MISPKDLIARLESLRRTHSVVEDCWYSCPESGECCDHDSSGCQCGATKHNERLDQLIKDVS